jgi:hypothetical protein
MTDSQRTIHPDFFGNPNQDARTPQRETPPELGGVSAPIDTDTPLLTDLRRPRSATDDRATHALERMLEQSRARELDVVASANASAAGVAVLDLQGPAPGFLWVVRRINAGPLDYSAGATFTGITTIGIKSAQAAPGTASGVPADSGGQVFSQTNLFPAEGTWGRGELVLLEGERLLLIVIGLTANFLVTSGAHIQQYAAAVGQTYGL